MDAQHDPDQRDSEREQLQRLLSQGSEAVLIVNTKSRRGQRLYEEGKHELRRRGLEVTDYPVRDPTRVPEIVQEAVGQGRQFLIVGGGDGTISAVAGSLAYRKVVLGLLPLGTANNFARGNNIPLDVKEAVSVLAAGRVATVDLGRVNEGFFTNAVSIGLSSALHRSGPDLMKKHLGRAGYLLAAIQRLKAHQPFRCRLVHEGETFDLEALDLRVANGPFYGGLRAIPRADPRSGELIVRIITGSSKWRLGRVWAGLLLGETTDAANVQSIKVREVEINITPRQFVSVAGEIVTHTPIRILVAPKALHLIVS